MDASMFTPTKRHFLRESLVAIPTFCLAVAWLICMIVFRGTLFHELGYFLQGMLALVLPLTVIGIGQLIYGCLVLIDALTRDYPNVLYKIIVAVVLWLLSQHLGLFLYVVRALLFFTKKSK